MALPLVQEFGYTQEIEDRVLAPLPVWAVGVQKIVTGVLQGLLAAARRVPASPRSCRPRPCTSTCTGWSCSRWSRSPAGSRAALGLVLGTRVEPQQVPLHVRPGRASR